MEERLVRSQREGVIVKTMPLIKGSYVTPKEFTEWNKKPSLATQELAAEILKSLKLDQSASSSSDSSDSSSSSSDSSSSRSGSGSSNSSSSSSDSSSSGDGGGGGGVGDSSNAESLGVSEGRYYKVVDLKLENEKTDESTVLIDLNQFSASLQSHLIAQLNKKLIPLVVGYDNEVENTNKSETTTNISHSIIHDKEILLLIDISSTMTTLDNTKREAAVVVCSSIMSLSSYGIIIRSYVFGDRGSIWRLYKEPENNNTEQPSLTTRTTTEENFDPNAQLLRIVDALRVGNRFGSYPLDAAMAAQKGF
jgi:hypothetical protein